MPTTGRWNATSTATTAGWRPYCPPGVRRRLFTRHAIPGFGDPILRTRLLHSGRTLHNLAVELALGRIELVDEQHGQALRQGHTFSPDLLRQIEQARRMATEAQQLDAAGQRPAASTRADESLAISVPAGEHLSLEVAQAALRQRQAAGQLRDFLFGSTGGGLQ